MVKKSKDVGEFIDDAFEDAEKKVWEANGLPEVSGDKATIKANYPFLSIHEFDGVKYQVTAVLKGGYVELTRKA